MQVVYEKLAIVDEYLVHHCWKYGDETLERYASYCFHHQRTVDMLLCNASMYLELITNDGAKMLQKCNIFLLIMMNSLTFLESFFTSNIYLTDSMPLYCTI